MQGGHWIEAAIPRCASGMLPVTACGRPPTDAILHPLTAFRSAAVGPPRTGTSPNEWPLTAGGFKSRLALEKRRTDNVAQLSTVGDRSSAPGDGRYCYVVTKGSPLAGGAQVGIRQGTAGRELCRTRHRTRLSLLAWIRIAGIWLHGGYTDQSIPAACRWDSTSP